MNQGKKIDRRRFLNRALAFTLGGTTAVAGIFAALRGAKIEPFLCLDSNSVLKRFGTARELLDELQISNSKQTEYAKKIARLKIKFDKNPSSFQNEDFTLVLQKAVQKDFKKGKVVLVKGWILSETEIAVFIFNKIRRYGLVK